MRKKTILTLVAGAMLTIITVFPAWSQPGRPAPVPALTGAASLDPSSKSTGTVDWNRTAQEIDGFGASGAFQMARNLMNFPEPQRTEVLDILFSQSNGAGLSMVRNIVGDGGTVGGASPTFEPQEGVWDWTVDEDQIWLMKQAWLYALHEHCLEPACLDEG